MSNDWFTVHKEGLAQQLARKGNAFAVLELLSNAWDEDGVTTVSVRLLSSGRGEAELVVEDDAPDGFASLADAWTLFAPSKKKINEEKRGRFNIGEKLVLALCREAEIVSTRGGVRFDSDGRHSLRKKRERGSTFTARIRFTQVDIATTAVAIRSLIPPKGIDTWFNGELLKRRSPVHTFRAGLPSERADDEGYLRPTRRQTDIMVYEPLPDEAPSIYEMGIPVVGTGDKWHIDIAQKVPLNTDRDNVTPAYLRLVRTLVMNEMFGRLTETDAKETWAREALADERVSPAAVTHSMDLLFGERRVAFDPSDPEANKRATAAGYTVVTGGSLSAGQWANVRKAEAIRPAGKVTPGHHVLSSPDGVPPIPQEKWTPEMKRLAVYTMDLALELLGFRPHVKFYNNITLQFAGVWGERDIGFNIGKLGRKWVDEPNQQRVDELLLHEFAHDKVSDHLSDAFADEIARLGAKMRTVKSSLFVLTEEDERLIEDIGASHGH